MKILLIIILCIHAVLHLPGFIRAFYIYSFGENTKTISKTQGILWLTAAVLFILASVSIITKYDLWWIICLPAILLSQYLIILNWRAARYGSIVNLIVLIAIISGYAGWHFRYTYLKDVSNQLSEPVYSGDLIAEDDIKHLPPPVQRYLRYAGVVGKPHMRSFSVSFSGSIRKDSLSSWMPFTSEQYNFVHSATRLFFMKATMYGLPVSGYHHYSGSRTDMDIRLLSLFRVQYQSGAEMDTAETVTFFNDMCCMAPGTLTDPRIKWTQTGDNSAEAVFTARNISIKATLYFNNKGELINFVSDNRYATTGNMMQRIRWSTPLYNYRYVNGYRLATSAETIYHYPSGDFCYGKFNLQHVSYK